MRTPRSTIPRALTAVAVVALGAGRAAGSLATSEIDCDDFSVTRAGWRATDRPGGDEERLRRRRELADGIVACKILDGATRSEVERLLGDGRDDAQLPDEWSYYVGPERGLIVIDGEYLDVSFRDGRVARVALGVH